MADFISKADYEWAIKEEELDQILEGDDLLLGEAEETAITMVKDALSANYDIDAIFATVEDDRPKQVLLWVKNLTLYLIFSRIDDILVPERIIKNYNDTLDILERIEDGKKQTTLPRKIDPDTEEVSTKFRWGSRPARSHGY